MKRQVTDFENIFAKDTSTKGPLYKIYKELLKFNNEKKNNPIKKWVTELNRHLNKEEMQMKNKHMKRCSTSYVTEKM